MDCSVAAMFILDLLDRKEYELPQEVVNHIENCSECRQTYQTLHEADQAIADAVPYLAPQRTYLTPERLAALQEAVIPHAPAKKKIIDFIPPRLRYAAVAAVAVAVLSVSARLAFNPGADSEGRHTGIQQAQSAHAEQTVFQVYEDIDRHLELSAVLTDTPETAPQQWSVTQGSLLKVNSDGLSIPVRKTSTLIQDDYWW